MASKPKAKAGRSKLDKAGKQRARIIISKQQTPAQPSPAGAFQLMEKLPPPNPKIAKVAVIWFPGSNCEEEATQAAIAAGIQAEIVRWNSDPIRLRDYDGYILPGGWSYEDRIRAGVIASKDPIMDVIKSEADKGKPVIGICNGAQILVEKGMVPATKPETEMALAPNHNPLVSGYYCSWVQLRIENTKGAFTSAFKQNEIVSMPVAHGEGRFVTIDPDTKDRIRKEGLIACRYCDANGKVIEKFPTSPNGSLWNIAAIYNKKGNVLAIMPHPERASWKKQLPGFFFGQKEGEMAASARKFFDSMKNYIERMKKEMIEKNQPRPIPIASRGGK